MTVLECQEVSFVRPAAQERGGTVLNGIDVRFEGGGLFLITGRTGAGKSTLMHILGGLIRPTRGRVLADGRPVSRWISRHRDQWRRQVGIVFQQLYLAEEMTVLENIMLPLVPRCSAIDDLRRRCTAVSADLDLKPFLSERPSRLSGGERQRVALARALVTNPRYLLADEPTAFQDDAAAERIMAILETHAATGAVVVVCSHDIRMRQRGCFFARYRLAGGRLFADSTSQTADMPCGAPAAGEAE